MQQAPAIRHVMLFLTLPHSLCVFAHWKLSCKAKGSDGAGSVSSFLVLSSMHGDGGRGARLEIQLVVHAGRDIRNALLFHFFLGAYVDRQIGRQLQGSN